MRAPRLSPEDRACYQRLLEGHPDLAEEVRSLRDALEAMTSLEAEPGDAPAQSRHPAHSTRTDRGRGHVMRFAAMIAMAFLLGYILRGMEPNSGMPTDLDSGAGPGVKAIDATGGNEPGGRIGPADSLGMRLAVNYLSDRKRTGLSRSIIAYARATKQGNATND